MKLHPRLGWLHAVPIILVMLFVGVLFSTPKMPVYQGYNLSTGWDSICVFIVGK